MIKKLHYCWFGGKMPVNVTANVEKWKQLNPDFQFCQWDDSNTDVSAHPFGRRALDQKKWGFVSDIVRLQKLQAEGGVYLDTDVELIRPLNFFETSQSHLVLGYIYNCALGTAVIYSPPQHPTVGSLIREYDRIRPQEWPVNNTVFTDYFINYVPGFFLNGRRWESEVAKISLYPKEFFEQPSFVRKRGLAIHHCSGSWMPANQGAAFQVDAGSTSHQVKWLKRKVRTFVSCLRSEYRCVYWQALQGRRIPKISFWRTEKPTAETP